MTIKRPREYKREVKKMAEEKSGKWSWLKSDTVEQLGNIVIYSLAVGGVALFEQLQLVSFSNPMVTALVGLVAGFCIDGLKRFKKDNSQ